MDLPLALISRIDGGAGRQKMQLLGRKVGQGIRIGLAKTVGQAATVGELISNGPIE